MGTSRTWIRYLRGYRRTTNKLATFYQQPIWTGHGDFLHPFEFVQFVRDAFAVPDTPRFDVMQEAKAKDIALLRLRRDLSRYAPDVAAHFGIVGAPESDDTDYYTDKDGAGNETDDKMVE